MNDTTGLKRILYFPLTKMLIGILIVVGTVALVQWAGTFFFNKLAIQEESKNVITAIIVSLAALCSYVLLFKSYEQRGIEELSRSTLAKNAVPGFLAGLILQSLFILVIYLYDGYSITHVNPFSSLLPGFSTALTAGFVAEIVIVGIVFRLTEEKLGTAIALIICAVIFAVIHSGSAGATLISTIATTLQAGVLLPVAYVMSRSLWLPIFLHFAWDFAEPGIYGGINPGNNIGSSLFTSKISGTEFITGGPLGPQNSVQAILLCLMAALLFLWIAKRKNRLIKPYWKK